MTDFTISIFANKTFFEIIKEIKLFSKYKIKYYDDIEECIKKSKNENQVIVFFENSIEHIKTNNFSSILISSSQKSTFKENDISYEELSMPFKIMDFKKKIISAFAKNEFKKNSLISLGSYVIDKNERKIKRNDLELKLSEKEIDFLILFTRSNEPVNKNLVLKKVWNYSHETETHTVETHIHRLRKKFFDKFGDKNFIKNNKNGYYI